MPSARHLVLKRRSLALQKHFLPRRPSLTGKYSKMQLDRIAAYFVLAHAELESYIEDKVVELIDYADSKWNPSRTSTWPLLCMLSYVHGEKKGPPENFDPNQFKDREFMAVTNSAMALHRGRVKVNHGVREKNLCDLLFPVGFSHTDIDSTLVASLDSFGQRRGDFAHKSMHTIGGNQIDPFVEAANIATIVTGLETVDSHFQTLRR